MVQISREKHLEMDWRKGDAENLHVENHFDYVVLSDLVGYLRDVEKAFSRLGSVCDSRSRIIITQYNYLWEPLLQLAQAIAKLPHLHFAGIAFYPGHIKA